jgi:hypothetical protein
MIRTLCSAHLLVAVSVLVAAHGRSADAQTILPSQTQTAQPRSFDMPLGAPLPTPTLPNREAPRPRTPIGDDALEQIKKQPPSGPRTGEPVPPRSQVQQPQAPLTTCQTNSATGSTPSDIVGAVGPTNLVVGTNNAVNVYSKSNCALVASTQLNTLFNAATGEDYFDPQVLWDNTNGRFIVAADSSFSSSTNLNQNESFAVSKDNTGTSWWVYQIQIINGTTTFCVSANTTFWDYPHVGSVNGSNPTWMIIANVFPNGLVGGANVITFPKAPTLSGGAVTFTCFTGLQFGTAPANVLDANSTAYLLSVGAGSGNSILRYALDTVAGTISPPSSISITAWSAPASAAQPNGVLLDSSDGRFVAQTIQKGTNLWNIHSVANGSFAVGRLYQFSTTATSPLFTKDLFTASNDNIFNVSVATNATQAFVSASRTIPSDPVNGLAAMLTFRGNNSANTDWVFDLAAISSSEYDVPDCSITGLPYCRWGDTSSAQIDPTNNHRAWAFNQLITGPSQFTQWTTNAALEALPGVNTHDYNANLESDIAWRDGSGNIAIWLMNGAQVVSAAGIGAVPATLSIVGQRDFNGDNRYDLLWRDNLGNTSIWFMNGTAVASGAPVGNIPINWSVAATGDFNGDGLGDILWRDTSGNLAVWLMNGAAVLSTAGLGNVPNVWIVVGTGDFNGDGKTDLLWRDNVGNTSIWFMNGTVASAAPVGNIPTSWQVVGTGDFNGDGMSDIVWRDTSGNTSIWLMNGATVLSNGGIGNVPTVWSIVQTGDYNGDGMSDLLWRDTSGHTAMWFMNGTSAASIAPVGTIVGWTVQATNAD